MPKKFNNDYDKETIFGDSWKRIIFNDEDYDFSNIRVIFKSPSSATRIGEYAYSAKGLDTMTIP